MHRIYAAYMPARTDRSSGFRHDSSSVEFANCRLP
jgi:hypothetical protein